MENNANNNAYSWSKELRELKHLEGHGLPAKSGSWKKLHYRLEQNKPRHRRYIFWYAAAASIFMILLIPMFGNRKDRNKTIESSIHVQKDMRLKTFPANPTAATPQESMTKTLTNETFPAQFPAVSMAKKQPGSMIPDTSSGLTINPPDTQAIIVGQVQDKEIPETQPLSLFHLYDIEPPGKPVQDKTVQALRVLNLLQLFQADVSKKDTRLPFDSSYETNSHIQN